jgi:glycosyltransferase involved in cell wall biosynthesis
MSTMEPNGRSMRLAVLLSHPIQYFSPLLRRLAAERDIDLTVFYGSTQSVDEYLDAGFGQRIQWDVPLLEGYRSKFLPNLRRSGAVAGFASLLNPSIVTELRRGRFDALVVHGHSYATNLLAIFAAKLLRIPVFMRCETHLGLRRAGMKRMVRRPLMTAFYRHFFAGCLPIGTRNRDFYRFHSVSDSKLHLVPYAVDNDYFMRQAEKFIDDVPGTRTALGLPADKTIILFASKLMARKRPLDLLEAFHRLRQVTSDAALVFVGSGSEEDALRSYVKVHSVPDVHFLGFRNQSELPKFYAVSNVFVLPSEDEPWGLIINEVMCAGKPVVATEEIGAVTDLIEHGKNGLTYQTGDVQALANHLLTLVEQPRLSEQMGARSREIIAGWDFERCVAGIRSALASATTNRRKRSLTGETRSARTSPVSQLTPPDPTGAKRR